MGEEGGPDHDQVRRRLLKLIGGLVIAGGSALSARLLLDGHGDELDTAAGTARTSPSTSTTANRSTTTPAPRSSTPSSTTSTTSEPTTTVTQETTTTTAAPIILEVISKAGWSAGEPGAFASHSPVRITFHHTASPDNDPEGALQRMRGYQRYHMDQGWPDIAYHFMIDQAGRVFEGRPPTAPGDTFTEYDPTGHFLPCLDGNYDERVPSEASIDALVYISAWAVRTFGIDLASLGGHRDHASTSCPGDNLYALRDEVLIRLRDVLQTGRPVELRYV